MESSFGLSFANAKLKYLPPPFPPLYVGLYKAKREFLRGGEGGGGGLAF